MKKMFMPSMMCVNISKINETVAVFESNGIAGLHIDVMDGCFVPNIQLGTDYCRQLRRISSLPMDYHLMIDAPERKLDWFPIRAGDWVSVHVESTAHLQSALDKITALGAMPIAALNPATPICALEEVLPCLGGVLVMTVNPGHAGQRLIPSTIDKICRLRRYLDDKGYEGMHIEADGNVSLENYKRMAEAGADMFVIGSSGFLKREDIASIERGIKEFADAGENM